LEIDTWEFLRNVYMGNDYWGNDSLGYFLDNNYFGNDELETDYLRNYLGKFVGKLFRKYLLGK